MKKTIYNIRITFEWSNRKKTLRATKSTTSTIEVITTSVTPAEILTDSYTMGKILRSIKKKAEAITLRIINVETLQDCGLTNDRF
tara:strand:+ start:295 stop:549 length:255 start_codon:yes stop_codon:yes gene_type:complete